MKTHSFFEKTAALLQGQRTIGGLEISDSAVLYSVFEKKEWKFTSMRLPPGVVEAGQIKNEPQFHKLLQEFRTKLGGKKRRRTHVILSLSSLNIYSQVFSLPLVRGQNLADAVQLNLQMIAPSDFAKMYAGWQVAGEDAAALKSEILSAFVPRTIIDAMLQGLSAAGFSVVAIESRALSVARLIREQGAGLDLQKPYAVFSVDDIGLDVLIVRHGQLYFEYFNSWRDLRGDERQIPVKVFEDVIVRDLYQVFNFYNQHWPEPLTDVLVVATGLQSEIERIVKANFSLTVQELKLKLTQPIGPEWFVALGSGLRGAASRRQDQEMSLSGTEVQEEYRREEVLDFLRFWRILVPVALVVLIAVFGAGRWFLEQSFGAVARIPMKTLDALQAKELADLEDQARRFDQTVDIIQGVKGSLQPKYRALQLMSGLAADRHIIITNFSFQGYGGQAVLRGIAPTTEDIKSFNEQMSNDVRFQNVAVPPSSIAENKDGSSFLMTFSINPPAPSTTP